MNLLVVRRPELWSAMERHLLPLVANRHIVKMQAGCCAQDFRLREFDLARHRTVVLGGCDATHPVLTEWAQSEPFVRSLAWMHSYNVGMEGWRLAELPTDLRSVPLSNARGASSHLLAEHVLLAILYFNRHLPLRQAAQSNREWRVLSPVPCKGRTLGILGFGDIGRAVTRTVIPALGMRVLGVRRSGHDLPGSCGDVEVLTGPEGTARVLAESDVVVNILPRTAETESFMDRSRFSAMRPGSLFINVGRGATVVEDDLLAALQSGHLRGAALDVFRTEPLPPDSPLWAVPPSKLLITSHDAAPNFHCGGVDAAMQQFVGYFQEFARSRSLPPYLVDWAKGY